jgi:hypothetical protein
VGGPPDRHAVEAPAHGDRNKKRLIALHRAVLLSDETARAPFEWLVSLVCREFPGLRPSEAVRELEDHGDLVMDVLELRAYVQAFYDLKNAKSEGDVPKSKAVEWVWKVQAALAKG